MFPGGRKAPQNNMCAIQHHMMMSRGRTNATKIEKKLKKKKEITRKRKEYNKHYNRNRQQIRKTNKRVVESTHTQSSSHIFSAQLGGDNIYIHTYIYVYKWLRHQSETKIFWSQNTTVPNNVYHQHFIRNFAEMLFGASCFYPSLSYYQDVIAVHRIDK